MWHVKSVIVSSFLVFAARSSHVAAYLRAGHHLGVATLIRPLGRAIAARRQSAQASEAKNLIVTLGYCQAHFIQLA